MSSLLFVTIILSSLSSFFLTSSNAQNEFTIKRTVAGKDNFDHFKVPQSNCTHSGSHCKHFHKEAFATHESCTCSCPYIASTFGFIGNLSWGCMENKKLRSEAGCSLRLEGETDPNAFRVTELTNFATPTFVTFKGSQCVIEFDSTRYLTCSGSWSKLPLSINNNHISVILKERIDNVNYKYYIVVFPGSPSPLAGLFISLSFKCPGNQQPSCVLFKIAGQMTCQAGKWQPPIISVSTPATTSSPSPAVTPAHGMTTQESPRKDNREENSSEDSSGGIIGAVVTIILLGLLVALIVGYVYWKKRRGESVWILDQCSYYVGKVKPKSQSSKKRKQEELDHYYNDDNIYAEIPEVPGFTFVEGRTTTPGRGIPVMSNTSVRQDPGLGTSLRQGRKSLTDEVGYEIPVEFEDSNWNTNINLAQNGTLNHARGQEEVREGYTVPQSGFNGYNENTGKPFMVSKGGKSYHFANNENDEYAEPNVDLPEYNVLEETDLHLPGTNNSAYEQTESYKPEDEQRMTSSSAGKDEGRKKASMDNEQDYDIPETDLLETNLPNQQNTSPSGEDTGEGSHGANNLSTKTGERGNHASYVNKRTRRRPPSPPRAPTNSTSGYI